MAARCRRVSIRPGRWRHEGATASAEPAPTPVPTCHTQRWRRRELADHRRNGRAGAPDPAFRTVEEAGGQELGDLDGVDELRLVFTCCHPALATSAQVALTLRYVANLSTDEIARAFVVAPTTMAQRLVRAKRRIRDAGIPFHIALGECLVDLGRTEAARTHLRRALASTDNPAERAHLHQRLEALDEPARHGPSGTDRDERPPVGPTQAD